MFANSIGEDDVVLAAAGQVMGFEEKPEVLMVGAQGPEGETYQVGGALDLLRKIIEVRPVPTMPGAATS